MTTTPVKARVEVLTPAPGTYDGTDLTAAFLAVAEGQEASVTATTHWSHADWSVSVSLDATGTQEDLDALATALRNLTGYPARDVIVRRRKR